MEVDHVNAVENIKTELKSIYQTVGLTKAAITMRGIFQEVARSFAGKSQKRYVSVIITDGKSNDTQRVKDELKSASTDSIDVIIIGEMALTRCNKILQDFTKFY